jgi:Glycosyltransferase family 92
MGTKNCFFRGMFISMLLICFLFQQPVYAKRSYEKYQYQIAACMMFYNESYFLKEWLEYHKLIGIEHFYLFNNGSTDNYLEILNPYILSGEVQLFDYPEKGIDQAQHNYIQCEIIYTHALALSRGKVKWLAIIDADEFIYPVKTKSLREILKKYDAFGGVYINYLFFGTSNLEKIPYNSLIIESLNHSAEQPIPFGKSIVRPERVENCTDPHRMWYHPPYTHVNTDFQTFQQLPENITPDTLLLFHYYTGDIDHAMNVTFERRKRWISVEKENYLQSVEWMNVRLNQSMGRFVPKLKKRMFPMN